MFVGIDLGTTNSALACTETSDAPLEVLPILQLVRPGDRQARPSLPSFLYLAGDAELPAGALDLPWASERSFMVGEAARERGAEVPLRLVGSAKSWLSHAGVDRRSALLPPDAPAEIPRVSPLEASRRYLEHLRDAFAAAKGAALADQQIVLTVPASFDAVARDLTLEAAHAVGLEHVTLLEEPQAAFYAFLAAIKDSWRDRLHAGDRILVCDIGGGTTDFTLIEVRDGGGGQLGLERVAVGDHLLLGGDNMDLALAHLLHQRLVSDRKKVDAAQQRALVIGARRAKEQMLSDPSVDAVPLTLLGRGSRLIGGKLEVELRREDLERVLLDGFFPACERSARPQAARRTGFMELGLPYVQDAAITRHLAAFVGAHTSSEAKITHVLFNGGVFNSPLLRKRLHAILASWSDATPDVLEESDTDLAVAKGAAYYAAVRAQGGIRIRGGAARAYYVGIEGAAPAVPGVPPPLRAMCVVPFGLEEGTRAAIPGARLGLVVGEPAEFRFFSTSTRKEDALGAMLDEHTWPEALSEGAPITATLEAPDLEPGTLVPVHLEVHLTEVGTVELWSVSEGDGRRWRLEYDVRSKETAP